MTTYCINTPFAQSIYHVPFQWNIGKQDEREKTHQATALKEEGTRLEAAAGPFRETLRPED
jgi:hypothetical protein